ncbi:MAG: rhombosortase [Gammaproteobacteria bacterium]|nr:rhombosortase [Gammaproteobacteria bacterium]
MNRVHRLLRSLNCDGRFGVALLAGCALLIVPSLWGEHAQLLLRYERGGLAQGQWWRLVSMHVIHLGPRHALANALALALLWALFARDYSPRAWTLILVTAAAAVDAGLWFLASTVTWYAGSSGVLHGVLAAGAVAHVRRGERDGWPLLVLLAAKLAYEQGVGGLPFSGTVVVVDAHLYGVVGGLAACAFLKPRAGSL